MKIKPNIAKIEGKPNDHASFSSFTVYYIETYGIFGRENSIKKERADKDTFSYI